MEIKMIWQSLRLLVWMTILTGLIYPVLITFIAYFVFHDQATGSLLYVDGKPRGSRLISQKFSSDRYFWPRPSAVDFNSFSSGGSNLGPISNDLKQQVENRSLLLSKNNGFDPIPLDLLFASGSGLDPHISPEAAYYQLNRVANARSIKPEKMRDWIDSFIEKPTLRVMGTRRINVLLLNQFLDANSKVEEKHG